MNERVLIIDDEPDVLATLSTILKKEGYQVKGFSSGKDAIEAFQSAPFDLVITDIRMPEMDGLEVMKQIKKLDKHMEIIVLTGYASLDSAIKALRDNDAFEYLTKPLENIDAFINAVNQATEKRRLCLENEKKTAELAKANKVLRSEITERKRAEDTLYREKEKFRILVEESPIGVSLIGENGQYRYINPKFVKIFGYTLEDIPTQEKWFVKAYPNREYRNQIISSWMTDMKGLRSGEYRQRTSTVSCKDGSEKVISFRIVKMSSGDRFVIHENITERKQLESQLQHAQKMESIGTLAGGIAHDFNNLLMGIQGNVSLMLLEKDTTHPDYEKLKHIEDYVQDGADLTNQLLGFARGGKYDVRPADLNEILARSSHMFGRTKKEIRIHTKYQDKIWPVELDRGQIEQALLNLYVNAWQAMPAGGELYLETRNVIIDKKDGKTFDIQPGKYTRISLIDTGVGMDEDTQQRIFEPFFTTKEMGRGTGLGLASVYGIIKNHGGHITVSSKKAEGTTFTIYLPASERVVKEEEMVSDIIKTGTETILLADDEDMIVEIGSRMLKKLGYKVLIARSGKEAVDIYKSNKDNIDIVLLDMIMPLMGGGETYDRMKEINPNIKVLLSSGYSIDGQAAEILKRGCDGFIQKPFNLKEVSQRIQEILHKAPSA